MESSLSFINLNEIEKRAIASAYRLYDYKCEGKISRNSAIKLCKSLGYIVTNIQTFSKDVSLKELLYVIDSLSVNITNDIANSNPHSNISNTNNMNINEPSLESSLQIFGNLIGHYESNQKYVNAKDISDFMESLGRPPCDKGEAISLLESMLEYDDCSSTPQIPIETFKRNIQTYSRRNKLSNDMVK